MYRILKKIENNVDREEIKNMTLYKFGNNEKVELEFNDDCCCGCEDCCQDCCCC